jgi:hypothetical protein
MSLMRISGCLLVAAVLSAVKPALAVTTLLDNFDGGGVAAGTLTLSPPIGTYLTGGRMFKPGGREMLVVESPAAGLPFSLSDDSEEASVGNTVFPTDFVGVFGKAKDDKFFGISDTFDAQNPDPTGLCIATWTVNTTGLTGLMLQVDIGAMGDFEATGSPIDRASFSVSFDGGAFTPIMLFNVDEAKDDLVYRQLDIQVTNATPGNVVADPMAYLGPDGVLGGGDDIYLNKADPATGALDTLTAAIAGTGASMTLRFETVIESTAEGMAFDNLSLISAGASANNSDFNNDGTVDGDDFLIWQRGLGSPAGAGDKSTGDANGDLAVNGLDLQIWRDHYNLPPAVGAATGVPEPASLALVLCGLVGLAARRRRS